MEIINWVERGAPICSGQTVPLYSPPHWIYGSPRSKVHHVTPLYYWFCCAVAYFSRHALFIRYYSGCNPLIYIEYQWRLHWRSMTTHIQDADQSSIWPTLRRNSIPTVWVELSIRRGLMPKFCRINPSFLNISEVQITCDATLQHQISDRESPK